MAGKLVAALFDLVDEMNRRAREDTFDPLRRVTFQIEATSPFATGFGVDRSLEGVHINLIATRDPAGPDCAVEADTFAMVLTPKAITRIERVQGHAPETLPDESCSEDAQKALLETIRTFCTKAIP